MPREWTNKLIAMLDDGSISADDVAEMCLCAMSEDDVFDMMDNNGLTTRFSEDDEPDVDEATEWHDFDPEC